MTREEFAILAKGLRSAYQKQSFLDKKEDAEIWYEMLKDLSYKVASYSVQKHIMTNKFPPTIAEIRQGSMPENQFLNAQEAWSLVMKATRNGIYHSRKEFDALPEIVQKAVGSPESIYNMAMSDDSSMSVKQSHFMKVYGVEVERAKERALIPERLRALIENVSHAPVAVIKNDKKRSG